MRDKAIQLHNLTIRYEKSSENVLENINLIINHGETILLLGPNGSGKTTLLRLFSTLIPYVYPAEINGYIRVLGIDPLKKPEEVIKQVGYIGHDPESQILTPFVKEEIGLAHVLKGVRDPIEIQNGIYNSLKLVNALNIIDKSTVELSGGETTKTVIAFNLAKKPRILLLDEPTAFLDKASTIVFKETLMKLKKEKYTIVIATHKPELYIDIADKIYLIENKKLKLIEKKIVLETISYTYYKKNSFPFLEKQSIYNNDEESTLIYAHNIWFKYPRTRNFVIRSVNLIIKKSRKYAIMGPNGSGKTTLLKILVKHYKPVKGIVKVKGRPIYIPQDPRIFFTHSTIRDELEYMKSLDEKAYNILNRLRLTNYLDKPIYSLSYGLLRKAAIAIGILGGYEPILLDEPTAGLDKDSVYELINIVNTTNAAMIITTHDELFISSINNVEKYVLDNGVLVRVENA